jgi:RNA polymerase sigma factor (sigma-70 family)
MRADDPDDRLTLIKTQWTMLFQAHRPPGEAVIEVQQRLLRYYGAVYRYLLGMLRDPAAAEELTQEFAVRFLRGDFKNADPQRGRFRDFLKTAVRHLALDHWQRRQKATSPLPSDSGEAPVTSPTLEDLDRPFLDRWREELLARTWEALAEDQAKSGHPYHTVLRWKTEQPQSHATDLAERLGALLKKEFTEEAVRQLVHRSRARFADLLVEEVSHSLETSEVDLIEQELIDLDLLDYCRTAVQRRRR